MNRQISVRKMNRKTSTKSIFELIYIGTLD